MAANTKLILTDRISRNICCILINRPEKRNALNAATVRQLRKALDNFEKDDTLTVAILGGVGGTFSAGYDLNEVVDRTGKPQVDQIEKMLLPPGPRLSSKITIASVEGFAAGFGYELALKCDFRVIERDARMGFLNRRFDIPIMNGGTVILPTLIGYSRSIDLVATGKAQLAHDALQYGLVNDVVDIGCAQGRCLSLARSISKFNQTSLVNDVRSLASGFPSMDKFVAERKQALAILKSLGPSPVAVGFLEGRLCRHGDSDLGTLAKPDPEVTL